MRNKKGFTLIELVICVVIFAIVAFPVTEWYLSELKDIHSNDDMLRASSIANNEFLSVQKMKYDNLHDFSEITSDGNFKAVVSIDDQNGSAQEVKNIKIDIYKNGDAAPIYSLRNKVTRPVIDNTFAINENASSANDISFQFDNANNVLKGFVDGEQLPFYNIYKSVINDKDGYIIFDNGVVLEFGFISSPNFRGSQPHVTFPYTMPTNVLAVYTVPKFGKALSCGPKEIVNAYTVSMTNNGANIQQDWTFNCGREANWDGGGIYWLAVGY